MIARRFFVPTGFAAAVAIAGLALPGGSLGQDIRHMCSEKYQAAKAAGTLGGETWPQFYSRCTAELKTNPASGTASPPPQAAAPAPLDVRHICSQKYQAAKAEGTLGGLSWPQFYSRCTAEVKANPAAAAPATPSTAVFPTAIAPEYASEKPARARMKTCQKQYNANKAANANGGLKWIQKGGGYWSECNKRLKS